MSNFHVLWGDLQMMSFMFGRYCVESNCQDEKKRAFLKLYKMSETSFSRECMTIKQINYEPTLHFTQNSL